MHNKNRHIFFIAQVFNSHFSFFEIKKKMKMILMSPPNQPNYVRYTIYIYTHEENKKKIKKRFKRIVGHTRKLKNFYNT